MSRVAAIKNAFRPRPPGPLVKYTPEQIVQEEVVRMGEPVNKDTLRASVEKWIAAHPRQTITAKEIRSALSIPSRNMSGVRTIGEALRRLCQKGRVKGAWVHRPESLKRQTAGATPMPNPAEEVQLFETVLRVFVRVPTRGEIRGLAKARRRGKR